MSRKNPKNVYLSENNLNDHIQAFDMIRTEKLPDEMDLELYDIVVYETDGMLIVHRIVEIEEPNETHPDCRYFRLQGDAVDSPDRFPVLYGQMRAIYRGERVPFIGSFILFMQSPAGWLCILLIVVAMIATPILENLLQKEKDKRLLLYVVEEEEEVPVIPEDPTPPEPIRIVASYATSGKVGAVHIATLNAHYLDGDVVDIHSLKQKKLIEKNCKRIKILENGVLDKALTVCADGFSPKAISKITQAGGKIIKSSLPQKQSRMSGGDRID